MGDPYARDPELVKTDVDRGLVTSEGARRYGVVIAPDGAVDSDATAELRAQLKAQERIFRSSTEEARSKSCEVDVRQRRTCERRLHPLSSLHRI